MAPRDEGVWLGLGRAGNVGFWGPGRLFRRLAALPEGSLLGWATGEKWYWHCAGSRCLGHPRGLELRILLHAGYGGFHSGVAALSRGLGLPDRRRGRSPPGSECVFGVWPRAAVWAEAAMISIFTLLV